MNAVARHGVSIALACRTFQISETCYRYNPVLSDENEKIADWLERLTANKRSWGLAQPFAAYCAVIALDVGVLLGLAGLGVFQPVVPAIALNVAQVQKTQPKYIFETIAEAQDQATEWLWPYNNERPNMGIGGITPAMKLKTAA